MRLKIDAVTIFEEVKFLKSPLRALLDIPVALTGMLGSYIPVALTGMLGSYSCPAHMCMTNGHASWNDLSFLSDV